MTLHAVAFSIVSWASFWVWEFIPWFVLLIVHAVCFVITQIKAPVEHPNNPLEEEVKSLLRSKCLLYMSLIITGSLISIALNQQHIAVLMALSAASAVGTFLVSNRHDDL